jgi:hypothetical protein
VRFIDLEEVKTLGVKINDVMKNHFKAFREGDFEEEARQLATSIQTIEIYLDVLRTQATSIGLNLVSLDHPIETLQ